MSVKVYSFKKFDSNSSQYIISDYFATEEAIKLSNLVVCDKNNFYLVNLDELDGNGMNWPNI